MFELLFSVYLSAQFQSQNMPEAYLYDNFDMEVSSVPEVGDYKTPGIEARSFIALEVESNIPLIEYREDEIFPIASLTKLMTALIILENYSGKEVVTISKNAVQVDGSKVWLKTGEKMNIDNLLKALLIKSGNDAAVALSEYHSKDLKSFVGAMNSRAKSLKMLNTNFANPHGLDDENNYSTASDLLILTQTVWKFPKFREIVKKKESSIYSFTHPTRAVQNTNELLSNEILGIKTGTTKLAGQCLILYIEKENKKYFTVVLGSKNRFSDSEEILSVLFSSINK